MLLTAATVVWSMVMMNVVGAQLSSAILRREFSAAAAPTAAPPLISPEDQFKIRQIQGFTDTIVSQRTDFSS